MAQCSYCKHTVSPSAKACPSCGQPDPADDPWGCASVFGAMFFFIFLFGFLKSCVS